MLLRRYLILLKRVITKYINIILMISIPLTAFIVSRMPEEKTSVDIVCGFYFEENSTGSENVSKMLLKSDSGFVFEKCDSEEELENGVAAGVYECGYYFGEGFEEAFITDNRSCQVLLYTSPSTTFDAVTSEIVYDKLLNAYSPNIAAYYLKTNPSTTDLYSDEYYSYIKENYDDYMNSDKIFKITANSTGTYSETASEINMFPVRKFMELIILFSALFGMLAFLRDNDNGVYNRLSKEGRFSFRILNILSNMTPMVISGYITLIVYEHTTNYLIYAGNMLIYILICLVLSTCLGYIFRHYKNMLSAMPVIMICALISAILL